MRHIDLGTWPRREHFKVFGAYDYPHFSLCANVDVTALEAYVKGSRVKERSRSLNTAIIYVIAKAANGIAEFRYRIRGDAVVEHEVVHPSSTVLATDDLFSFCTFDYVDDFPRFARAAAEQIEKTQRDPTLHDEAGRDDYLFLTAIPWVAFTSFMHPLQLSPADSVPRMAWGKITGPPERREMPLSVQAHHALMDGLHMGRYFEAVQAALDDPARSLA